MAVSGAFRKIPAVFDRISIVSHASTPLADNDSGCSVYNVVNYDLVTCECGAYSIVRAFLGHTAKKAGDVSAH